MNTFVYNIATTCNRVQLLQILHQLKIERAAPASADRGGLVKRRLEPDTWR